MPNDPGATQAVAAVIGLPAGIRGRLEQRFANLVTLRALILGRDGGFRLEPPPKVAARLLEQFADEAQTKEASYAGLVIVVLPYGKVPQEVNDTVVALEELGAHVVRAAPGTPPWPSRPPRLDQVFQDQLLAALILTIERACPAAEEGADTLEHVAFEILRGLASHSKMGSNNHSHEDDLWKSRGKELGSGGRARILRELLGSGLLGRKKNDSAGGKGWVYWIADVQQARQRFPALEPYFR